MPTSIVPAPLLVLRGVQSSTHSAQSVAQVVKNNVSKVLRLSGKYEQVEPKEPHFVMREKSKNFRMEGMMCECGIENRGEITLRRSSG